MKEKIKNGIHHLKQRTRFLQGMTVGFFVMSAISFAAVTFNTFTANTTISAADMNANFTTIKNKLDQLDIGFTGGISADFAVAACDMGQFYQDALQSEIIPINSFDYNDGNFNLSNYEYTFPATGVYRLYAEAPTAASQVILETYNGTAWASEQMGGMMATSIVRRFTAGQKIRLKVGCGKPIVDKTKFIFALRKF